MDLGNGFIETILKAPTTKKKIGKLDIIKLKTSVLQRSPSRRWKDNPQSGKRFLQIAYLIGDLYPEYFKKNYYNLMIKQ